MAGQGMGEYCVDIVMCIDATGSMAPILDEVKRNAISFYEKFIESMDENDKEVETLRIKVIAFRDYGVDPEPMVESQFFKLPEDNDALRHVVLVFSDAPALPLGARAGSAGYPTGMPADIAQLGAWWEATDQTLGSNYQAKAGRLVAFVPNAEPWTEHQAWNRYWPAFSPAGTGLPDVDIQSAIDLVVGSF